MVGAESSTYGIVTPRGGWRPLGGAFQGYGKHCSPCIPLSDEPLSCSQRSVSTPSDRAMLDARLVN